MAEHNPPLWLQNRTDHTAENERSLLTGLYSGKEGVLSSTALTVVQNGTPNMSVNVSGGRAIVLGDESANQGMYLVWNDGVKNVTIAAADPTNPRRDIIVARVKDAYYSGATNAFSIEVIQGTPAGSPADPSIPSNALPLARVAVAASASSITNANITDLRTVAKPWYSAWGEIGRASTNSLTQVVTTIADVTGISVTFTAVAGRRYRYWAKVSAYDSGGSGLMGWTIADGSNNALAVTRTTNYNAAREGTATFCTLQPQTPTAGSFTVKLRAASYTAAGTHNVWASSSEEEIGLWVEDIGPG